MENPNAHGVRLQKHHSMQSTLRRRSSVLHSQKLPMKSNPYVGSFRHAPPATTTTTTKTTTNSVTPTTTTNTSSSWSKPEPSCSKPTTTPPVQQQQQQQPRESKLRVPVTLPMKSSPYIGWFRHAPPCTFSCRDDMKRHHFVKSWWEDRYAKVVENLPLPRRNDLTIADLLFSGHLKGGGRGESTHRLRNTTTTTSHLPQHHHLHQQQQIWLEAAAHGVFYAFRIVARLASGFAYDAESMKYLSNSEDHHPATAGQDQQRKNNKNNNKRYHRRSYHHEHDAVGAHDDEDDDSQSSDSSSSSSCEDDEEDANSIETSSLSIPAVLDLPADLDLSSIDLPADLELSVSSLAEAYYAHQAAKDLDLMSHCSYLGQDPSGLQFGHHRLDYVITQLDIARMARNASRHLDVESIYNLPTTTYHARKRNVPCATPTPAPASLQPQHFQQQHIGRDATEGFSWLIIPAEPRADGAVEDASMSQPAPPPPMEELNDDEEDVCVICFEHFSEGDRLRVLPCQHSFHMGCIDRWLSGSHSSLDCVTSGCPTCKKRPSMGNNYPSDDNHATLNGSVPAWAFAQIGESLAAGSQAIPSTTTTTTTTIH